MPRQCIPKFMATASRNASSNPQIPRIFARAAGGGLTGQGSRARRGDQGGAKAWKRGCSNCTQLPICAALAEHANGGEDSRLDRACACRHRGWRYRARQAQCEGIAGAALVTGALTFICVNGRVLVRLPPEMLSCNMKAASAAGAIPRPRPPTLGADGAPIAQESHDALFDRVESASRLPAPLR